jgi:ATPase subunit of ABC transporter with duplicated ATPase domains
MIECSVYQLSKSYGANKVFENISFEIKTGERIGLVGQNGCGKSTLMKILMGREEYGQGSVHSRKGAKFGYLEQMHDVKDGVEVEQVLWQAFEKATEVKKNLQLLEKSFTTLAGVALERAMIKYGQYMEVYESLDGYQLETKINQVCEGLSISAFREMPFGTLSGGEKTRVILAKLLLESPSILLLDEPSNHLDIFAIEWLENYLKDYKGTVLVISHDRYFLDRVVTKIYELEPNEMVVYHGNYSAYAIEKERRYVEEFKRYQNQQKQLDRMKEQIHRYRVWGAMRDSDKMYKKAKEIEKRVEKMQVLDRPVLENKKIKMDASIERRSGKEVIILEGLEKSFDEKSLMKGANLSVFYQDRICLMGANGSGKTTLLKLILEEMEPDKGTIRKGAGVKIGYLPQDIVFEEEEQTVVEYFSSRHQISLGEARGILAKVLFTKEDVHKRIKNLSGGEKSRLKLCSLTYEKVNVLILDEPTNHLDIDSREALEETLMSFEGTLFFVSHDRYFIEKIAEQILWIEGGVLSLYPFGYTDFLEKENKQVFKTKDAEKKKTVGTLQVDLERQIEELEEKEKVLLKEIEENYYDYNVLNDLLIKKTQVEEQIKNLYLQYFK